MAITWITTLACAPQAEAAVLGYCDAPQAISAAQQDRLFRLAATVRHELQASGQALALVSRSGTDLSSLGQRYSHAGLSLKDSPNTAWSVRQLYYACDQGVPRIFDQGLPGFVLGNHNPDTGFVSVVLLPEAAETALLPLALQQAVPGALLGLRYSANAHAFSTAFQNCNQWVAELLAAAWGAELSPQPGESTESIEYHLGPRERAQLWLRAVGYVPTAIDVGNRLLMGLATAMPWVNNQDHPAQDLAQARYRVSMPESLERFVRQRWPAATRLEFCLTRQHIVIRQGWQPLPDNCSPQGQDRVILL